MKDCLIFSTKDRNGDDVFIVYRLYDPTGDDKPENWQIIAIFSKLSEAESYLVRLGNQKKKSRQKFACVITVLMIIITITVTLILL